MYSNVWRISQLFGRHYLGSWKAYRQWIHPRGTLLSQMPEETLRRVKYPLHLSHPRFSRRQVTDDKIHMSTLPDPFIVLHYEVTNNRDFGAYVKNPAESDLEDSVAVLERVGWTRHLGTGFSN